MIKLSKPLFIAQGTNRACYIHPDDKDKCIKVTISDDFSESQKEIKYYKFLEQQNISWNHISKHYNSIDTDLGTGEVFDLIRDDDGEISKTLSYYLQEDELTKNIINPITLLNELKEYTLQEGIVIKDLNTKNMLYQKIDNDNAKLILIDGVMNNDFLFYSNYFDNLRRNKLNKVWTNFEQSLREKYSYNQHFINLLKEN